MGEGCEDVPEEGKGKEQTNLGNKQGKEPTPAVRPGTFSPFKSVSTEKYMIMVHRNVLLNQFSSSKMHFCVPPKFSADLIVVAGNILATNS